MLEQVMEITSFNSQTCLPPGEQIIKYCLMLLFRNIPDCSEKFKGKCMILRPPVIPPRVRYIAVT